VSNLLVYLTAIAGILGILRYMYRGAKSMLLKGFKLTEKWNALLKSVADMADTLKLILSRLDDGKELMTELQHQTNTNSDHIALIKDDLKGAVSRIERLEER
jgi:nitrogen regulatory protein PII-like uncharacterized protein